ncbi:MAG: RraA family protein [Candidatus Dormiibacterota bacterium]
MNRTLTGKVPEDSVHDAPTRVPRHVVEGFKALGDLSGTIADVLDELGINGAIAASTLRPTVVGARVVGVAVTVRNVAQRSQALANALKRESRLAEIEGHNQAVTGDVLVIQGVAGVSNMGGISASIAHRQGEAGAVVDGGIRDVAWQRSIAFPIWSSEITPITGKWRAETVEVNGVVTIRGVTVRPGDLVAADDTGVCFVPADLAESVLSRCQEIAAGEARRHEEIDAGVPVPDLAQRTYVYQYPGATEGS